MLIPEKKIQIKLGRPPKYNADMVKKAEEYLTWCVDNDETPFLEELALRLGVWDTTLHDWVFQEGKEDFAAVFYRLKNVQKLDLKKKALKGKYISKVATLLLTAEHNVVPVYRKEVSGIDGSPIEIESRLLPAQEKLLSEGITKLFEQAMRQNGAGGTGKTY